MTAAHARERGNDLAMKAQLGAPPHSGSVTDQPKQLSRISRNTVTVSASAPGTTRTCDLGIRRPLLYPPELRRQCAGQSIERDTPKDSRNATRPKSLPPPHLSVIVWSSTHAQHRLIISR